jgi:hypothetical protein
VGIISRMLSDQFKRCSPDVKVGCITESFCGDKSSIAIKAIAGLLP